MVKVSADIIIFAYWNFDIIIIDKFSKNSFIVLYELISPEIYLSNSFWIYDDIIFLLNIEDIFDKLLFFKFVNLFLLFIYGGIKLFCK